MAIENKVLTHSLFTEYDIYLFKTGKHYKLYEKFGSHAIEVEGNSGIYFAVFAPAAENVSVVGNFNQWNGEKHNLYVRWDESGIWEGFIPDLTLGELYKFSITSTLQEEQLDKSDPFALFCEHRPGTASIIWNPQHEWDDYDWMSNRHQFNSLDKPLSIYELHVGSWKWHPTENRPFNYRELAVELVAYLKDMNFTHVEFMPIMEYPYDPSWGYQITGYFAPTSRFGSPEDFMYLVDALHQAGIGVILDWVPSHFPDDSHGLAKFDGSCVYEHPDRRKGYHPDWSSMIFNFERPEIRSFLISNALFWLDRFHIDGLRVDAVASMIYLDYSRNEGEWEPNVHGGNEYLEAISFLQDFNRAVYAEHPSVVTIAEESTAFAGVTKPADEGGLGFKLKWMMGWMHDTLKYFGEDPIHRSYHQNTITFSLYYAFSENFTLPLSHDEVVHGKRSLLGRMPGDEWERFANLRVMYAYMYMHPGSKLLFMGAELAQYQEWAFGKELDWNLLDFPLHQGVQKLLRELNTLYKDFSAFHEKNYSPGGFEWIDASDNENSIISFIRRGKKKSGQAVVVCNFTPVTREEYEIGLPATGKWKVLLDTDGFEYGGRGALTKDSFRARKKEQHGQPYAAKLFLPPLSVLVLVK